MYNSSTEYEIKDIPVIGDIDIDRLPQELTLIYAQIIGLRRQVIEGTINFDDANLASSVLLLRKLANNLETILLTNPHHEQKESIAFVAGTANSLIHKLGLTDEQSGVLLEIDFISSYIAASILFLIGNSQADAAETALSMIDSNTENLTLQRLISSIVFLATGKLSKIANSNYNEFEVIQAEDFQQTALNYLWRELGLGIIQMAKRLVGQSIDEQQNHFNKVIDLSYSDIGIFGQRIIISGPLRLAKLLKILEEDIFDRAIIDIPAPLTVDSVLWKKFLSKLAKDRPYLWENHKEAVTTNFLTPGISAVITLPTGAGKSTLAELKIASCLYSGKKVIYLVPTHALEDQVSRNFRILFSEFESFNITFGSEYTDFEDIDSFPIQVMTPERCLTLLNVIPDFFDSLGLIIFDEFHLIHGRDIKKDRRSIDAMYCLLSLFTLALSADYLLISAMVENGEEIASWLKQITKRECKVFNSTWKPTRQLHGCLIFQEDEIAKLTQLVRIQKRARLTKYPSSHLQRSLSIAPHCFFSLRNIWETEEDSDYFKTQILDHNILLGINKQWQLTSNRNDIAARLAIHFSSLGLKTLVFVDNPVITNSTSRIISEALQDRENCYHEYILRNEKLVDSLNLELGNIQHSFFHNCTNVGVHHGLLLPLERTLIEDFFKLTNGSIALVATTTLAQGINLPAEIVIIAGDDRYDEDGENRQRVNPHELLNAAGRAGRAGLSSQGAVILIPGEIVTIKDSTISNRWWQLKNEVFSKGDQCLEIEDPLEYFLDSLQDELNRLSFEQINLLYRFKPENLSDTDTKKLLSKSFYAFKSKIKGETEQFDAQVRRLLDKRNELDNLSEEILWQKEISVKTGLEPQIIYQLTSEIEHQEVKELLSKSIIEIVDWFFYWLGSNEDFLFKIFTKQSTIDQIKRAVGLKKESLNLDILPKMDLLRNIFKSYIMGRPLNELNNEIPDINRPDNTGYLIKARNFVNRLVPDVSFGFGLVTMIITEKAHQEGLDKTEIPWDIRVLASCIREGFDSSDKLFYKKNNALLMRVETHKNFDN